MEWFSLLPFSIGCVSHSSVDVIENQPKKLQAESNPLPPSGELEKSSPKANIGGKLLRVVKGFKSLSYWFHAYRDEEDDDDDDDLEMEISLPTDVQHVGHIGWDSSNTNTVSSSCLYPLSMRHFELAAAKEDHASI